jgi:hypothetical protein
MFDPKQLQSMKNDRLKKAIQYNLDYYKGVKQIIDANNARAANILLTKRLREHQDRINLNNDYTRVLDYLDNKSIMGTTREALENRRKELKNWVLWHYQDLKINMTSLIFI